MDKLIEIIYFLTKQLPHRGSTTLFEKKAAQYVFNKLKTYGYTPVTQKFLSATSAYYPALLFGVITALSILVYMLFPFLSVGIISISLMLLSLGIVLFDSSFIQNPFTMILPKKESQNIIARLPSFEKERNTLVVIAHIDSHRTPLLFSSPFWVFILKILIPLGVSASIISCVIIMVSIGSKQVFTMDGILTGVLLLFIILTALLAQADRTTFTTGANDNASGVALTLVLAKELKKKPFKHTSVYIVASGSEEVGSYGARAFIREYKEKLEGCYWLTIDGVSACGASPAIICSEKFFLDVKSDPTMIKMAQTAMKEKPAAGAFLLPQYKGAYTDSSPAGLQGYKVLSLIALKKSGELPAWHTLRDNFESIDKETLSKCFLFTKTFIEVFRREIG